MHVKVFEAEDMTTGLRMIRKELGPDALILSTKTVKNGKLGLLGKATIEITAAIDRSWPDKDNIVERIDSVAPKKYKKINHTIDGNINLHYQDNLPANKQSDRKEKHHMPPSPTAQDTPKHDALRSEVDELKNLVQQLAGQIVEPNAESPQPKQKPDQSPPQQAQEEVEPELQPVKKPQPVPKPTTEPSAKQPASTSETLRQKLGVINSGRQPILHILHQYGIDGEPAMVIADYATENMNSDDISDPELVRSFLIRSIEGLVDVEPPDFETRNEQKRIALIGPTGVGKTTTLAKLAALYLANHSNSIALITIDTYRIAAVEQLKVYGEIMHLPVDVVISPEQLKISLEKHKDKELILIDTAGRSPKDNVSVSELSLFLQPELHVEKHLVLSAGTRESEILDTINRFAKIGIDKTIFTKVDECSQNGIILNIQTQNKAPLSFITNGQRVPEDLLQIDKHSVAKLILTCDEGTSYE
jgi:flagellar biosynthesis protein FlhF